MNTSESNKTYQTRAHTTVLIAKLLFLNKWKVVNFFLALLFSFFASRVHRSSRKLISGTGFLFFTAMLVNIALASLTCPL